MASYKNYHELKDTRHKWLGKIPVHWNIEYSKWLFAERKEKANADDEMLTASQKYGVLPQKIFMKREQQKVVEVQKGQDILKRAVKNDFVISMRSFQGGIEYCPYTGSISSAYVPLRPRDNLSVSYYKYLFKSTPFIQALQSTTNLVRDGQALRYSNFIQVNLPTPSIEEGSLIGKFLDHETAKIDILISKQEKLIELLKEKRQAMVDSAIKEVDTKNMRLGRVVEQQFRLVDRDAEDFFVAIGLYNRGRGIFHKEAKEAEELGDSTFYWAETGDLIISGQFAWEGSIALASENDKNTVVSHRYPILKGKEKIVDTQYLWAFLTTKAGDFLLNENSVGAAGRNRPLNINSLFKEKIPVPPLYIQLKISVFVTAEMKLIKLISKEIEILKEKKSSLISAVVTGKIDVRDWQEPIIKE
jgi:type I restriction enzyme S subunit